MAKTVFLLPTTCSIALSAGLMLSSSVFAAIPSSPNRPIPPASAHPASAHDEPMLVAQLNFQVRGVRTSRNRVSGISRGGACSVDGSPVQLTALLPKSHPDVVSRGEIEVEATLTDRPTFFVYIPQNLAQSAQFNLSSEDEQTLYQTTFTLPAEPSVVAIGIPDEVPPLQVGSAYHWSLTLLCDPVDRSGDLLVEGWVQRTELSPALTGLLENTPLRDRPAFYSRMGIWQDTLSTLAALRLAEPENASLTANWASLLNSVDLGTLAGAPLINVNIQKDSTAPCECNPTLNISPP